MALITRHGGGSHYVRPDAVYRTSVLQSIVGYQPQADVQAVAAAFTLGPTGAMTVTGLSGLRGAGPIATWWANVKAKWAAKFHPAAVAGIGIDPASMATANVAPDMAGRLAAVMHMGIGQRGMSMQRAMSAYSAGRQASLYWAR